GFGFEKSRYKLETGKEKRLTLRLKTSEKNPDLSVTVSSTNQTIVAKGGGQCSLRPSKIPGIYTGSIVAVGKQDKTRGVITARLAGTEADAEIYVDAKKPESGFELRFEPVEENYDILRYKWDVRNPYLLHIGAKHPTVRRYLGELTDDGYVGIDSPHYRTVLAELIAEALAFRILRTVFDREGENKRLDFGAADLYYHRYHSEFLELAQSMLLEQEEIDAQR
ncbi:MAG TPA: hypothetical protein VMR98_02540, partial [Candidatus Polarisedimenticolaceae bacterium]|nr:hypothetical protein [Candidatus Polarisedimenticolaceae bacterium]